jgi:hypothetical protein
MNAPFNIVQSARSAYSFIYAEHKYILRLALFPTLIKLVCYVAGLTLGYDDNMLRMALILLPASLVEGWMLSHVIRLIVLNQRWPFQPTGDTEADLKTLEPRMRGVMSGLITYALINMLIAGVMAVLMGMVPDTLDPAAGAAVSPQQAMLMMLIMAGCVWGFPLLWLYIPMATGMDPKSWAKSVVGLKFSFPMIAIWMLCYLPVAAITLFGVSAILSPFGQGEIPTGARFAVIIIGVILDTAKALLGTAGMTYALTEFYKNSKLDKRV